ncbi:nitric oxide reductase transcriptional regulator NorR [uncultured Microbulbifer sp.]|uniref:nitric oxide reductase transcriptional regulator NorR n=1 Tax=uncultured Microbulbifer sp. TaxID=348147 RepID=UPI002632CC26|nr:nitric oxide reductase transcriptional regulator NorR [uncultured Microbulbifer sp.]
MTDINANLLLEVALDLANSLNNSDRFERLLSTIRKAIKCDAVALLGLNGDVLTPLAVQGLARRTLGRRFIVSEHPRLAQICASENPVRFPSDCALPDPFDGLLLDREGDLPVHSCMGLPLYSDNHLVGLLTLDSMAADAYGRISDRTLELIAALSAATLKTALELKALSLSAEHAEQLVKELTQEAFLRDGGELIGESQVIKTLRSDIELVAGSDYNVLILGETGVGKELVARTVHRLSPRREKPLVYLNCASLTETLAEAELFGHAKGAFTGADRERPGKFLLANGGTIFLDEVGELPLAVQSKLLRVLQSGEIQPVGKDTVQHVDVRIVAATNRELLKEIEGGGFRADLYHRLSVYPLEVPPLSQRENDVLLLADYFLEKSRRKLGFRQLRLSADASSKLKRYGWPGNVRELEHVISRAALKARKGSSPSEIVSLTAAHVEIPDDITAKPEIEKPIQSPLEIVSLRSAIEDYQRELIGHMLIKCDGNWSRAAKLLSVDRGNLVRLSKRLGIYIKKEVVGVQ